MKKIAALIATILVLTCSSVFAGDQLPRTLVGITLGEDFAEYAAYCDMNLATGLPDAPFLNEAHLRPDAIPGIRGGSLTYANCDKAGKLARIKLKFHDRSQTLFNKLLDEYKAKFGKPNNYKGDSFRNIIAWEWIFTNDGERISLLLMWSREREMRPGVSIKMTLTSLVDSEYKCFREKQEERTEAAGGPSHIKDLDVFIPQ